MALPWKGRAVPMTAGAYDRAAKYLNCEAAAVEAVFMAESSGRFFLRDGSVIRRFEPHKMPNATTNWRDSLKIATGRREAMFRAAYARSPDAALRATSFGGPQIMGFNAKGAGFDSAEVMVVAMADTGDPHLDAFVTLLKTWKLDTYLRAKDWLSFAKRYNGSGQAPTYARIIRGNYGAKANIAEQTHRRSTGQRTPIVLRQGNRGAAVRQLQDLLVKQGSRISIDGAFGRGTFNAVRRFQTKHGLMPDGVVGAMTWAKLTLTPPTK